MEKTDSSLEYVVLESVPEDDAKLSLGETVALLGESHFAEAGEAFDSADKRGLPIRFPTSGVIPGRRNALSTMRRGNHWLVRVSSDIAQGERGHLVGNPSERDPNLEIEPVDALKAKQTAGQQALGKGQINRMDPCGDPGCGPFY